MRIEPCRLAPVSLVATSYTTSFLPLPLSPSVITIQGTVLTAVHPQPLRVETLSFPDVAGAIHRTLRRRELYTCTEEKKRRGIERQRRFHHQDAASLLARQNEQ